MHPNAEVDQPMPARALWRGWIILTGCRVCPLPQLAAAKVSKSHFGQNIGNSVDISKAFFEMVIWKFESSQVSQAVWQLEIVHS
jgi:hypothetical protein